MDCTSIVLGMINLSKVAQLVWLGIACGAISMFIAKSTLLNRFHDWLEKQSEFFEDMLSCPWCTSHWVAAFLVVAYRPLGLDHSIWWGTWIDWALIPVDYALSILFVVVVAAVASRVIWWAYKPIMGE